MTDHKDKRKSPRFLMGLPLEGQLMDVPYAFGGIAVNGSDGGILFHSPKDIPIGTKLNIALFFSKKFELANFEGLAEIVWKEKENGDGYKYGLKFIKIKEEDLQKLRQLLSNQFQM